MDLHYFEYHKLYVIGNGFDIHHDIFSTYKRFKSYLQSNYPNVYDNLTRLYGNLSVEWWRTFEESLTEFDPDKYPKEVADKSFFEQLNVLVERYGKKGRDFMDWFQIQEKNGINNKYARAEQMARFEMAQLKNDLNDAFASWVKQLEKPNELKKIDNLDTNAFFFTFNYTKTLEELYGIDDDQVVHLHGSVDNNIFIIGHNLTAEQMINRDFERHALERVENWDGAEGEARIAMFNAAEEFKKPVDEIIDQYRYKFNSLGNIEEIEVLGMSYSPIDIPYLLRILEVTGKDVKMILGWHSDTDKDNAENFAQKVELTNSELIEFK